tara:strand:- start:51 stop:200 length:150 start_codon:yes stop_codon:yes gene_type:complete
MSDSIKKLYNEHLKEFKKDYPKLNLILFGNQHHKKIDKNGFEEIEDTDA